MRNILGSQNRIVFCLLVFIFAVFCLGGSPVSSAAGRTIKMGYFEYGSMCRGASEGAEKSGYVYDFMQKISSYTGWQYQYSYGNYADLYELLKQGKIDVLPYTNWNEQRSREVLFSRNPILKEQYFLATRANDRRLSSNDPAALNGKVIATVTGADQNNLLKEYLAQNNISAEIVYYDTPEIGWDHLRDGQVDAAVFSNISYRRNVDWNVFCTFGSKPTYIAVSKGNEQLLAELDEAFETILQTNPTFVSQLEAAVYTGNPAMVCLSEREKNWLKEHGRLRVGYLKNGNLVYVNKTADGTFEGFVADIIKRIFNSIKLDVPVEYTGFATPEEMGKALLEHKVDIVYPMYPSFTYGEKYKIADSNPVTENTMAVVYRKDEPLTSVMNKVAVSSEFLGKYYMENSYPYSEIVVVSSTDAALDLLRNQKVTGFVSDTAETIVIDRTYGNLNQYILSKGCETCFGANFEDSPLIVLMNRGISSISKSEIAALTANNTPAKEIKMVDYVRTHAEALVLVILIPLFLIGLMLALRETNRLKEKAQSASAAKTSFLFSMSHDIRTPMNAILGYTNIGLRHIDNKETVLDSLQKIRTAGRHLLNLINDILEMSRIEAGKLELSENPLDIREAIDCVNEMGESLAIPKSIEFTTVTSKIKNPYVLSDEVHFNEVFINLISNAVKYTQDGGRVEYRAEQLGEPQGGSARFRFTVSDNGIGMSEEFQKHLFESFSRENTATVSKQEGAGLGLSIVKKIIDQAGGTISVKSKQGEGSVFTVELPLKVMDEAAARGYQAAQRKYNGIEEVVSLENKKILLVEDNEMNREIATEILKEAGMIIETAEDGAVAVEMVTAKGTDYYDFILMDIQMPVMNGYEATRAIRQLPGGHTMPIIALSANAFEEDKLKSLEAGMNEHIAKPIEVRVLLEALQRLSGGAK